MQEYIRQLILCLDIGYIYFLYFIFGFVCAILLDKLFDKKIYTSDTNVVIVIIELFFIFWFCGILFYLIKNIVKRLPFPLHGKYGHDHNNFDETGNTWAFIYIFLTCNSIQNRILFIYEKFSHHNNEEFIIKNRRYDDVIKNNKK